MPDGLKIAFIGFGEAGQAIATGIAQGDGAPDLRAFDIKTDGPDAQAKRADYDACDVHGADSLPAACSSRDLIFSLVTAEQAEDAAATAAQNDLNGALFLDCNSCAPNTKRRSAARIEAGGGRYVDVAVMTPVHPLLHKAPCLVAGPHADAAQTAMQSLGMSVQIAGDAIGDASTRKMIRSTMIKGMEALTLECFLAARKAGIEDDIVASLDASYPGIDWQSRAPYKMERAATHGIRRAAEMREVAKTLRDLGIAPHVTQGTIAWQQEVGALGLAVTQTDAQDLVAMADMLLQALSAAPTAHSQEE